MLLCVARETGLPIPELERMHTARLLLWWHAVAWDAGTWTVAPTPPPTEQLDALLL